MTTEATVHGLTEAQERALESLLAGQSVTAAAERAGVSRQSVSTWKNRDPYFIAALNRTSRDRLRHAQDRLIGLAPAAIDALSNDLDAGGDRATRAARDILRALEKIPSDSLGPTDPDAIRTEQENEFMLNALMSLPLPDDDR